MMIRSQVSKVENGFIVAVTALEYGQDGRQPAETIFIADTLEEALEIIKKA